MEHWHRISGTALFVQGEEPLFSSSEERQTFQNFCPEVLLFDRENTPDYFKNPCACSSGSWDAERSVPFQQWETKHFSSCAEFAAAQFQSKAKMQRRRKSVPRVLVARLQQEIGSACPFCANEEVAHFQVHHINEEPSDNSFDNLLMLCPTCHSKITKQEITRAEVQTTKATLSNKKSNVAAYEGPVQHLIDTQIILRIDELRSAWFDASWQGRLSLQGEVDKFARRAGIAARKEVMDFLCEASQFTIAGMPLDVCKSIFHLSISFADLSFKPPPGSGNCPAHQCLEIGNYLAYDCAVKLARLALIPYGLTLWKMVYRHAIANRDSDLEKKVQDYYNSLEATLQRPERPDLLVALELVKTFRADLKEGSLSFPIYPAHIAKLIAQEKTDA